MLNEIHPDNIQNGKAHDGAIDNGASRNLQSARRLWLTIAALLLILPPLTAWLAPSNPEVFREWGENDVLQFWASYQLHHRGVDPYNPQLVFAVERARGWGEGFALVMWNPPWMLALLSPILVQQFDTAARLFLGLNLALITATLLLSFDMFGGRPFNRALAAAFALCSLPLFISVFLGQISPCVAAIVAMLLWGIAKRSELVIGAAYALLTIKPQLAYLVVLASLWSIRKLRILRIALGFALVLVPLIAVLQLQSPDTIFYWLDRSRHEGSPLLRSVYSWKTTSLATLVRQAILTATGELTIWPMVAVPALSAGVLLLYGIKRSYASRSFTFAAWLPLLIPVSCFTSPFAWIYDGALCSIFLCWLVLTVTKPSFPRPLRAATLAVLALLQLGTFLHYWIGEPPFEAYWYYFPALIALGIVVFRSLPVPEFREPVLGEPELREQVSSE